MSDPLNQLRSTFSRMSDREQLLVGVAGLCVLFVMAYLALVRPMLSSATEARQRAMTAEQTLTTTLRLRQEFEVVNRRLKGVEEQIQRAPGGNIVTTLENIATQSNVKVDSMSPQTSPPSEDYRETRVQVVLKEVSLDKMVNYLNQLEKSAQFLSVKSLKVRTRSDKPELLDVTFTVSTFEPV